MPRPATACGTGREREPRRADVHERPFTRHRGDLSMTRHIRNEHRIRIAAPADTAFMFFPPAGEELWVPGWQPHYLYPTGGSTQPGLVFTTGEGDDFTIWLVADFDRAARRA